MIKTEDTSYLINDAVVQTIVNRLYDKWISKCLDGTIECFPWFGPFLERYKKTGDMSDQLEGAKEQIWYNQTVNIWKERCSREVYEWKRDNQRKSRNDASVHDKLWWRPKSTKWFSRSWFNDNFMEELRSRMTELIKNKWGDFYLDDMVSSNRPMWYKSYMGNDGYMGWHTNADKPAHRWYIVYNTHNNASCMRFIDPDTKRLVTRWEPKGWSVNYFWLGPDDYPTWHCVYTKSNRFSFGMKIEDDGYKIFEQPQEKEEYYSDTMKDEKWLNQ